MVSFITRSRACASAVVGNRISGFCKFELLFGKHDLRLGDYYGDIPRRSSCSDFDALLFIIPGFKALFSLAELEAFVSLVR